MIKCPDILKSVSKSMSPLMWLMLIWVNIVHSLLLWYVIYKELPQYHSSLTLIVTNGLQTSSVMMSVYLLHLLFYAVLYATKRRLWKKQQGELNWEA